MPAPTVSSVTKRLNTVAIETRPIQLAIDDLEEQLNRELEQVRRRYSQKIDPLLKQRDANVAKMVALATQHRDLLTDNGKTKMISLRDGVLQWRTNPVSLVYDVSELEVISAIRQLGGMRRFTTTKTVIDKTALKKNSAFVDDLIKRGVAHREQGENLIITLPEVKSEIIQKGTPYKVAVSNEE